MHELAIAHALVDEAERVAAGHGAGAIERIVVRVGALSGVEAPLLERAYEVARAGTLASAAELVLEPGPIEVACRACGARSAAAPARLTCAACGGWQVDVTSGEELLLMRLELTGIPEVEDAVPAAAASHSTRSP